MTTFGLVHGAWHGAWCFERLIPALEAAGHRALAVDLPCEDTSVDFCGYAEVVVAALAEEDDVTLVGHSLGGLTIPLVAAARPVSRLVFLCALIPVPGMCFREQMGAEPGILTQWMRATARDADLGLSWWPDPDAAIAAMYQDCTEEDGRAAVARLRRQSTTPHAQRFPLDALPDVERDYVMAADDRVVSPDWSRRAAPERLGVAPIELEGGHSPFLARPEELARTLVALT